jgi:hypothetical protein
MPTGVYKKGKLLVDRQGDLTIQVYKFGPFLEIYVNKVLVGKVMKKTPIYCTDAAMQNEEVSGECLAVKNHIILLTVEEVDNINLEFILDAERKEAGNRKPIPQD